MESNTPPQPAANRLIHRVVEVFFILTIFFLLGGRDVPGINEPQYLGKAKHFWNNSWCPGDHFLTSADAHFVFYYTFGWLTKWYSLETVAWIGRFVGWLGLAITWQRLSWTVVPKFGAGILSAACWALMLKHFHLSGEWVVGGVEAKVFAYSFVLLGVNAIANDRWNRSWIYFGIASSFHVLVGGWSVVAGLIASQLAPKSQRPSLLQMFPSLVLGGLLSLPGLLPTLMMSSGIPAKISLDGTWYYVFRRLQHHLLFTSFPPEFMIRFGALALVAFGMFRKFKVSDRLGPVARFAAATLILLAIGIIVDLCTGRTYNAASLLRFYWFRLADVAIPLFCALTLISILANGLRMRTETSAPEKLPESRVRLVFGLTSLVAAICLLALVNQSIVERQRSVSKSDQQGDIKTQSRLNDWREICRWVRRNSNTDHCFFAPPNHQTFKWYAHRSEVVTWKDVPQDPQGIVEWHLRLTEIRMFLNRSFEKPIDEVVSKLHELSEKYGFQYFIIDKRLPFPKLPVPVLHENRSYAIYAIVQD